MRLHLRFFLALLLLSFLIRQPPSVPCQTEQVNVWFAFDHVTPILFCWWHCHLQWQTPMRQSSLDEHRGKLIPKIVDLPSKGDKKTPPPMTHTRFSLLLRHQAEGFDLRPETPGEESKWCIRPHCQRVCSLMQVGHISAQKPLCLLGGECTHR